MIKVLHYGLSPNPGGIENYLFKLWKNIDHENFKFYFADLYGGEACYRNQLEENGCGFFDIVHRKKSLIKNIRDWKRVLSNEDIDIIHCHLNTLSDITPVLLGLLFKKKVIVHSRSSYMVKSKLTMILHRVHFLILPKKKIKMLAVSQKAGIWLFGKKADFQVVNNGVDTNKFFYDPKKRRELRESYNLENKFVVGNVGVFLPVKNHEFVLEIFSALYEARDDAKLVLIGDGYLKKKIEEIVSEKGLQKDVIFLGKQKNVNEWYSVMDVLLFPSLFEGFPNVVLEAQATGLDCCISDTITEEVVVLPNCHRISLNAPIKEWISKILEDEKQVSREKAHYYIKEKGYDVSSEINKIEKLYKSLIGEEEQNENLK